MRILSIGATGFIAKPTLDRLIRLDHEVIAFHRGERQPPAGIAAEIHGDYRRLGEYREQLQSHKPDVVVHMTIANERQALDFINTVRGIAGRAVMLAVPMYTVRRESCTEQSPANLTTRSSPRIRR